MRWFYALLIALFLVLQYRLWASDDGAREVWRLRTAAELQRSENAELAERNSRLEAEVDDLRSGSAAAEERARTELGMIGAGETFYQVIKPARPDGDGRE